MGDRLSIALPDTQLKTSELVGCSDCPLAQTGEHPERKPPLLALGPKAHLGQQWVTVVSEISHLTDPPCRKLTEGSGLHRR
eukprot:1252033-Alexandrium_andersonii.AAC.1